MQSNIIVSYSDTTVNSERLNNTIEDKESEVKDKSFQREIA